MALQVEIDEVAATIRVGDGGGVRSRALERRLIEAVLAAVDDRAGARAAPIRHGPDPRRRARRDRAAEAEL